MHGNGESARLKQIIKALEKQGATVVYGKNDAHIEVLCPDGGRFRFSTGNPYSARYATHDAKKHGLIV